MVPKPWISPPLAIVPPVSREPLPCRFTTPEFVQLVLSDNVLVGPTFIVPPAGLFEKFVNTSALFGIVALIVPPVLFPTVDEVIVPAPCKIPSFCVDEVIESGPSTIIVPWLAIG